MLTFRFDRSPGRGLGATPIRETAEGYKVYKGVAAFGDVVLEYPEDGVNELAPTADVMGPGIAESIVGVPFSIHHPDDLLSADDPDTLQAAAVGAVLAARPNLKANPPELEVEVVVWTRPAQDDIESGRVAELSPGYNRDPEQAPRGAALGGKPYQIVQRKRRYNHLSGVIAARGVTPDGRRARLDEATESPTGRRDEAGQPAPPPPAWGRRDGAALQVAPPTHPARSAPFTEYQGAVPGWRGYSDGGSWVAFWPTGDGPGLLWEQRDSTGAVVGQPLAVTRADTAPMSVGASYAPFNMDDLITPDPAPTDDTKRADAEPVPEPKADADEPAAGGEDIEVAAEEMPLEGFSPDDAEVLKMLSPEGLARLMMAMQQVKAEAAEAAVMAAPPGAAVEVEAEDASAAAREKEAIGEVEKVAAEKAEAEVGKDATAPMAPQGLSAQDVAGMIGKAMQDLYDRMKADMGKADAPSMPTPGGDMDAKKDAAKPAAPATAKVDAAALAATIAERRRLDAAFVAHAKRDGHLGETEPATVKAAATKMLAVIAEHLPDLADMAKDALKDPKRMDSDFVRIYAAAEKKRRDALLDDQQQPFAAFASASGYDAAATSIIDSLIHQ